MQILVLPEDCWDFGPVPKIGDDIQQLMGQADEDLIKAQEESAS